VGGFFNGLVDTRPLVGHLAAWNYFMSLNNPSNVEFRRKWAAFARARNIAGHRERPLTNDPMEATYVGINMWKQAVERARTTNVDDVRVAMRGQTFRAPSGFDLRMDEQNHHLHKPVFIGEVRADGQFNVVWRTRGLVRAQPWSPFIPGNDRRPSTPQRST
jgi:urea transport system substrate-binding protein